MPQKPSDLEQLLIMRKVQEQLHQNPQPVPGQLPPRPATYKPDPLVVGTDIANEAHKVFNLAPELKNNVSIINRGPTPGTMRLWELMNQAGQSKSKPDRMDPAAVMNSNIVGYFGNKNKDIFVSPSIGSDPRSAQFNLGDAGANRLSTLWHELSHAAGYKHESGVPNYMEQLAVDYLDPIQSGGAAKQRIQPKKLDK